MILFHLHLFFVKGLVASCSAPEMVVSGPGSALRPTQAWLDVRERSQALPDGGPNRIKTRKNRVRKGFRNRTGFWSGFWHAPGQAHVAPIQ